MSGGDMGRRGFLKALGVAPMGAQMAAQDLSLRLAGVSGALGIGASGVGPAEAASSVKFHDFAAWFREFGAAAIRTESKEIRHLDADLITLHLPLVTKIRMQRERNYQRLLRERRDWFGRKMKQDGVVNWWPH